MTNTKHYLPLATEFLMPIAVRISTIKKEENAKIDSVHITDFQLKVVIKWKDQCLQLLFPLILGSHTKVNNTLLLATYQQATIPSQ